MELEIARQRRLEERARHPFGVMQVVRPELAARIIGVAFAVIANVLQAVVRVGARAPNPGVGSAVHVRDPGLALPRHQLPGRPDRRRAVGARDGDLPARPRRLRRPGPACTWRRSGRRR